VDLAHVVCGSRDLVFDELSPLKRGDLGGVLTDVHAHQIAADGLALAGTTPSTLHRLLIEFDSIIVCDRLNRCRCVAAASLIAILALLTVTAALALTALTLTALTLTTLALTAPVLVIAALALVIAALALVIAALALTTATASAAAATPTPLLGATTAFALVLLAALPFALSLALLNRRSAITDLGGRARVTDPGNAVGLTLVLWSWL